MLPYQEVREDGRSCSNASELNGAITGTWRAGCACGRSQKESKVLLASLWPRGQVDPVDKEDEVRHDQER
jgi:hypothetical protein